MVRDDYLKLVEGLVTAENEINLTKGREYAQGDEDALRNFKVCAEFLGLTPLQVCMVYMYKHFASLASYAAVGHEQSEESIEGRVHDLRNYAALFLALVKEATADQVDAPSCGCRIKHLDNGAIDLLMCEAHAGQFAAGRDVVIQE